MQTNSQTGAVIKRFLKGLTAYLLSLVITGFLSYSVTFLNTNPTLFGAATALVAALLLAAEKAIPNNL